MSASERRAEPEGASGGGLRRQAVFGLVDHAAFAALGLALQVFLFRALRVEDYGVFSGIFAAIVLGGLVQGALVIDLMVVESQRLNERERRRFLRIWADLHVVWGRRLMAFTFACAGLLALMGKQELAHLSAGFGLAMPGMLGLWFLRKVSYALHDVARAAEASLVYGATLALGATLLVAIPRTSVGDALGLLGLAAMAANAWLWLRLGVGAMEPSSGPARHRVLVQQFIHARPLLGGSILRWLPAQGVYLALPLLTLDGWVQAGNLRAAMNFVLPAQHAAAAAQTLLTTDIARRLHHGQPSRWRRVLAAILTLGLGYWVLLACLATVALNIVYGSASVDLVLLVEVVGAVALLTGLLAWTRSEILSRDLQHADAWGGLAGFAVFILLGVPLMMSRGALGAAFTLCLGYLAQLAVQLIVLAHWHRRSTGGAQREAP